MNIFEVRGTGRSGELDRLKKYRRELHQIPELGFHLPKTKEYIMEVLKSCDCEITEVCESGILARFFRSSEEDGKETIAFRSDMDALPVAEETGAAYQSHVNGRMHACGHDGHMAMLLEFAERVNQIKNAGELRRDVVLIFQPAEETTGGAKDICDTGLLEQFGVTSVVGFHLWPSLEAGTIGSRPGPLMAKSSEIDVQIRGKSAHCATASEGIDAIEAACTFLTAIYAEMEREKAGGSFELLKFGKLEGGTVRNAIAEKAVLSGTLRVFDLERFQWILERMEEVADVVRRRFSCEVSIRHSEGYPPLINHPELFRTVEERLRKGGMTVRKFDKPFLLAEDFSFYQERFPGVFLFLGTGTGVPLHSGSFDFDEKILLTGVDAYLSLL